MLRSKQNKTKSIQWKLHRYCLIKENLARVAYIKLLNKRASTNYQQRYFPTNAYKMNCDIETTAHDVVLRISFSMSLCFLLQQINFEWLKRISLVFFPPWSSSLNLMELWITSAHCIISWRIQLTIILFDVYFLLSFWCSLCTHATCSMQISFLLLSFTAFELF